MFLSVNTMVPLNWKMRLPPGHLGTKRFKDYSAWGVIDPDNLGEIWVAGVHQEEGELFLEPRGSSGHHLALPCLTVKVNRNTEHQKKRRGH